MAQATSAFRLLRRLRRRPARSQPDFADFGTAYGLELSMQAEQAACAAAVSPQGPGWWRRLAALRSTPAA